MQIELDDDGFLGQAAEQARVAIRERYRDYLDVAYAMNRVTQQTRFTMQNVDGQRMTASGLWIKVQNDAQAVILVAERGLPEQAMPMLRIAFEALVRLKLVYEDEEFWQKYRDSHEIFRRKSLEDLIAGRTGAELTQEEKDRIRAELAEVVERIEREKIQPLPGMADLVKKADCLEAKRLGAGLPKTGGPLGQTYRSLYQLGNQPTHSAPSSIHDYWTSDEDDFVTGFVHGARTDGLDLILVTATGVLVSALQVVEQLFDEVNTPPEAGNVINRFRKVKDQLDADPGASEAT